MEKYSHLVDEYIEKSPDFARPLLRYIREVAHECSPDLEETIKWKFPTFMYKGKILCSMVSFKKYCSVGFWLHDDMKTIRNLKTDAEKTNMFSLGKITRMEDLPLKPQLKKIILEAIELTDMGVTQKRTVPVKTETAVPDYFQKALDQNKEALEVFQKSSPSFRKEYIHWLMDAKTEVTRNKRMEQAMEWIAEGKGRNWKYEKKK
ncbi:YdeI/OmpD-associated family protein [Chryseobacterium taihuense]|uniref:Uncharacterized conserved protein YdeI, YjbR/CyaY-like superfamily, DUF1801 family n=1 Tax=Chryseobacterium taihuense TaxID=1141221 RepID=A0ABY0QT77_9FLAO|nr:YdeI/OmpD-associated family protein [Chryseobacterium taihuense]SDL82810.1 Uncharacterized conserved protein YdeI, YjbR/CyaY-like superfamily, DUF1801 family [Chryseobacterium taihuense]